MSMLRNPALNKMMRELDRRKPRLKKIGRWMDELWQQLEYRRTNRQEDVS